MTQRHSEGRRCVNDGKADELSSGARGRPFGSADRIRVSPNTVRCHLPSLTSMSCKARSRAR